jgi:hypothetical protein
MKFTDRIAAGLRSFWSFVAQYGNALVAAIATAGYLIWSFFPSDPSRKESHKDFYVDLGIGAVLWTLVEIKHMLDKTAKRPSRFPGLRDAQSSIRAEIRRTMPKGRQDDLHIQVFASRLLTARDMLSGILNEVANGELAANRVKFTVYCLQPGSMRSWNTPASRNDAFAQIIDNHEVLLKAAIDDLQILGNQVKSRGVEIEFITYRTFPSFYAFVIGDERLYIGGMTWDEAKGDFEGAGNPCYMITRSEEGFEEMKSYLDNRGSFYKSCASA